MVPRTQHAVARACSAHARREDPFTDPQRRGEGCAGALWLSVAGSASVFGAGLGSRLKQRQVMRDPLHL